MSELDPVIHTPARLRIMTTLTALPRGDRLTFTRLQSLLDATAGNLSTHLRRLEDAGYVEVVKGHQGRVPSTQVGATAEGRLAFDAYVRQIQALLTPPGTTRPGPTPPGTTLTADAPAPTSPGALP